MRTEGAPTSRSVSPPKARGTEREWLSSVIRGAQAFSQRAIEDTSVANWVVES
jgi:hypothetical protein